ncbi:MAG: TonB family protein [Pyrinomonadaceae bacterium]
MKYCPTCQTKYDDEILRFCTKDGSPLIDENQPKFTELPSENEDDDFGAETVIRRKPPKAQPETEPPPSAQPQEEPSEPAQRIVIPTSETGQPQQQPYAHSTSSVRSQPPHPPQTNIGMVIALTVLGTVVVLGLGGVVFWVLTSQNSGEETPNVNTNFNSLNENLNVNMETPNGNFDFNINANDNLNTNLDVNVNANLKTPSPSPSPSPSPETNVNTNGNVNAPTPMPTPSQVITPRPTPSPTASPPPTPATSPTNRPVNVGVINGRAVSLRTPVYPDSARQLQAAGRVQVQVIVDEFGNVDWAKAISGHPLLRSPAEDAARRSKFNPIKINGKYVKTTGLVVYNFVRPN